MIMIIFEKTSSVIREINKNGSDLKMIDIKVKLHVKCFVKVSTVERIRLGLIKYSGLKPNFGKSIAI